MHNYRFTLGTLKTKVKVVLLFAGLAVMSAFRVTLGTVKTKVKLEVERDEIGGDFKLLSIENKMESDRVSHFLQCLNAVKMEEEEGEIIDWYDDKGNIICPLPREFVHYHNLLHRGVGIVLRRKPNEVYMHKRSISKRTWPGLLDTMIGGIGVSGSSTLTTLVRELKEELNLDINARPIPTVVFLGTTTVETEQNQCIVDNYIVHLSDGDEGRAFQFRDGEIEWGRWTNLPEMHAMIEADESAFVPSGLQCFRYIESNKWL